MKKHLALLIVLGLTAAIAPGCAPEAAATPTAASQAMATSPAQAPELVAAVCTAEEPNFLLLVSDEPNDIGDFSELWVTISGVGFVMEDDEVVR